jgi:hypothetical protein
MVESRSSHIKYQIEHGSEQVMISVPLCAVVARVDAGFARGQGENQPASANIDGGELQYVMKELSIGLWILAVQHQVRGIDHGS